MRGVWIVWAAVWALLALPGLTERAGRPVAADAGLSQALPLVGLALLAGIGPGGEGKRAPALAVALVVVLLMLAISARLAMGADWSPAIQKPDRVRDGGAFAFAGGHPIYAFVGGAAVATALATRAPRDGVGAAMIVSAVWFKSQLEDAAIKGEGATVYNLADYRK